MSNRVEHLAEGVTLYLGDAEEVAELVTGVDVVVSDPPYPNSAGHFLDGIAAAEKVCRTFACDRWLIFWTEIEAPPVPLPLVGIHIWHRSNTNRPDNYEPVFVFNRDGKKRASRVLSYPVVALGLTGCWEATEHPTQKHSGLMADLIKRHSEADEMIFDPFMGSGTTGVAAVKLGRRFVGCEVEPRFFDIACRRIADELRRPQLFAEPVARQSQGALL
ncbi:site-specific DNA-methyltransferase [Methylobacterium bullatum]|uniref:Methyltransferase n=1 Tax=Methylobacterium bullatum TaxID=570505 RepID=A0AAV4ZBH7_9HYPH|nr:site-specific DNA-methyltransferase [Methylobacterium bullatum]MBD8902762.1 hypothetical protein [Methylobacterium bullatum]GJD41332.1 hypothetical protein OICFNHDK_3815 [Methylobacterium bullatum]